MNCIFCSIFVNEGYAYMFYLLLESIILYGNLNSNIDIVLYTTTKFKKIIEEFNIVIEKKDNIKYIINDNIHYIDEACSAKLDIFSLSLIDNYNKILYLDIDTIVTNNLNDIFDICKEDILYTVENKTIDDINNSVVRYLFYDEYLNYEDRTCFTSSLLLFKN
jgi:lipopolysaccharide biosynthesis glycosyltransferase